MPNTPGTAEEGGEGFDLLLRSSQYRGDSANPFRVVVGVPEIPPSVLPIPVDKAVDCIRSA